MRSSSRGAPAFHIFLIKPSKYDDDGYVIRHWRGVLPSNTLACLEGLTRDARQRGVLPGVDIRIHACDEGVSKVPVKEIVRLHGRPGVRVAACLVGVQTNQFPRAADIALELRRHGVPVLVGGFHVSGMLALFPSVSPEIQQLVDAGASIVAGEVEDHWDRILADAYSGCLQPVYRLLDQLPDLSRAPRPVINKSYLRRFISSNFGTIDCSRGCPFNCSFCTIINVQGRKSRHRSPECIAETLRRNYRQSGVWFYFFTDDDFARNPAWKGIFGELIRLREEEKLPIEFMMQVDTACHKIPGFVELAARAGCSNVFIGMESLNPQNLKEAGKTQNRVQEYRQMLEGWHRAGVSTHVGYIIGFPDDTEESVRQDLARLTEEVRPQRASFFMMTPIPGSRDHKQMAEAGAALDPDFNKYDSFHETVEHPHLKHGAWTRMYYEAWSTFYSFENMKRILLDADPRNYWDILKYFYWYKNSIFNERTHPMIAGFFRFKDRTIRRPGFAVEGRLAHWRRRLREVAVYARNVVRLTLEMEELWLATRRRSEAERRVLEELSRMRAGVHRSLKLSELRLAYVKAKAHVPSLEIPSRLSLLWAQFSLWRVSQLRETRRDLAGFWANLRERAREGSATALLRADRIAFNAVRELRLTAAFFLAMAREAA